jgi:type III pantothenate kinase
MITLAIDIGNTLSKAAVFDGHRQVAGQVIEGDSLVALIHEYRPQYAVLSSVGKHAEEISSAIRQEQVPLLLVTHQTPLPFTLAYDTPETLGMDRVAGVAAAQFLYPATNCLVIDAGTCITYDFISSDSVYQGGAISPGLNMRLRAMHEFTQKLPKPGLAAPADFEGRSTKDSILSGVVYAAAD